MSIYSSSSWEEKFWQGSQLSRECGGPLTAAVNERPKNPQYRHHSNNPILRAHFRSSHSPRPPPRWSA